MARVTLPFARRGEIHDLRLGPTDPSSWSSLCVVVSPDELNEHWSTVTVARLGVATSHLPFDVACVFGDVGWYVRCNDLHTVSRARLGASSYRLSPTELARVLDVLQEMFAL
jgi:mRNA interferase MazF